MRIHLNGEEREFAVGTTLSALVQSLELPIEGVAVALNRQVVPRAQWPSQELQSGDRVEIVRAVGGG